MRPRTRTERGKDRSHAENRRTVNPLERFAVLATEWSGHSAAFLTASGIIVGWALLGPWFDYSDHWQLVINTGTTIVTFLMVFLIQRAQNKQALALHVKLNELVAALQGASNRLIDAEDLPEADLKQLQEQYRKLIDIADRPGESGSAHSVDEASSEQRAQHSKRGPRFNRKT